MTRDQTAPTAAARAHAHLRDAIVGGDYPAGTMLSENELAARLSVSRTPVRAALARLREEGWVEIFPQRGAQVRGLSAREMRESAEVRHALETEGVRRSAPADRDALPARLDPNLAGQAAALAGGEFRDYVRLAMAFHREFVVLGGNTLMLDLYDRMQDRQQFSLNQSASRIIGDPDQVLTAHRALAAAAASGDWVRFSDLLSVHQHDSHDLE